MKNQMFLDAVELTCTTLLSSLLLLSLVDDMTEQDLIIKIDSINSSIETIKNLSNILINDKHLSILKKGDK